MGSSVAACQGTVPGGQPTSSSFPSTSVASAPPTAATLADFSNAPPSRRTYMDLFSTVGKQPQQIGASTDHTVHALCWQFDNNSDLNYRVVPLHNIPPDTDTVNIKGY